MTVKKLPGHYGLRSSRNLLGYNKLSEEFTIDTIEDFGMFDE